MGLFDASALTDDQRDIVDAVDRVCADFDDHYWATCDAEHRFPWEFYSAMAEGGWVGICIPETYGGGGAGIIQSTIGHGQKGGDGAVRIVWGNQSNGATRQYPDYDDVLGD